MRPNGLFDLKSNRYTAAEPHLLDRLVRLVEQRRAHSVLMAVEAAKIVLSESDAHVSDFGWLEAGLSITSTRRQFEAATQRLFERISLCCTDCIRQAGLHAKDITAVFLTGGTCSIPSVRKAILQNFDGAVIVDGDRFGSVGAGLAIEAERRYG